MNWHLLSRLHGCRWDCGGLAETLQGFVGGQFQMVKQMKDDPRHIRGEIQKINVVNGIKTVTITFNWLVEERLVHNGKLEAKLKWFPLERPFEDEFGDPRLKVPFEDYRSHPDEERVKMWGGGWNEVCRFFKPDDHTNLVRAGDEWIPLWKKHELAFKRITVALLSRT